LRILYVTPYYEGAWAYGGIPRLATALARGLARRGHHVTVCTTDAADGDARLCRPDVPSSPHRLARLRPWPALQAGDGVELRVFPNVSNHLAHRFQLFLPLGLGPYLRARAGGFDVAHLHGYHHLPGAVAARHLGHAGVPYVLAPNGTARRIERRRLAKRLFDATAGRGVLPGAARVLAVSQAERAQLLRLGVSPARIRLAPNPVDLAEFEPRPEPGALRSRLGLDGRPLVLYLGQLTPRKNVDVLIRAIAALDRPDVELVVAGSDMGVGQALRREAGRRGLASRAHFTGVLRGRERLRALADADLVVYPSRDEVFGLVPLEALLAGTSVIVAGDAGCGEIVARVGGGRVVPPGDVTALAAAIGRGLAEPASARRAVAEAAALRIRALYGSDTVSAAVETLYREVLADVPDAATPP
jgi:glycosyltransferase involved in cell wall biosynthesis